MNDVSGVLLTLGDRRLRFVAGARNAVELVEALMRRLAPALGPVAAEVPLAEERRSRSRPTSAPRRCVISHSVMPPGCVAPVRIA